MQGHKPYFFKQSELKKLELASKYNEMKSSGGSARVNKAIEKKRKHNAAKDHKFVPRTRRDDDE